MEDGLLLRILVYYYCLIKCDMRFLFQNHKYGQIIGTLMLLLVLTLFALEQLVPDTINLLIPEQDGVCFEEFLYQLRPNERKGNS